MIILCGNLALHSYKDLYGTMVMRTPMYSEFVDFDSKV